MYGGSTNYIDGPDVATSGDVDESSVVTKPSLGLAVPSSNQGEPALSQSYLNLIDDSAHLDEHECSDTGSVLTGLEMEGRGEPETHQTMPVVNGLGVAGEKRLGNGLVVSCPSDITPADPLSPGAMSPTREWPTSLELNVRCKWSKESDGRVSERAKVKCSHSRTRQKNIHCLETEV